MKRGERRLFWNGLHMGSETAIAAFLNAAMPGAMMTASSFANDQPEIRELAWTTIMPWSAAASAIACIMWILLGRRGAISGSASSLAGMTAIATLATAGLCAGTAFLTSPESVGLAAIAGIVGGTMTGIVLSVRRARA